jgi:hypothetical protein
METWIPLWKASSAGDVQTLIHKLDSLPVA